MVSQRPRWEPVRRVVPEARWVRGEGWITPYPVVAKSEEESVIQASGWYSRPVV